MRMIRRATEGDVGGMIAIARAAYIKLRAENRARATADVGRFRGRNRSGSCRGVGDNRNGRGLFNLLTQNGSVFH
jgi:hypothetical protein